IYTLGNKSTEAAHTIEIFDGYMYLNGCADWSPGGIVIFSLANPTQPQYVGQYAQRYIHDCYVRNDTIYGAAVYSNGGLDIINAHNKANPTVISRITYTGSGTHNAWTTRDGHYAMTTDEIGGTQKTLKIWDVSNVPPAPLNPAATYTINPADIIHNVTMRGNYAYVAWYTAGSVVVDITNPLSPQTAGQHDSYSGSSGGYDGVWAIYPYFPSGKIVSSDIQTGTYVYKFSHLLPRRLVHLLTPENNDTLIAGLPISFSWNSTASQLDDPHYFKIEITGDSVNYSQKIYSDTTMNLNDVSDFIQGKTYTWKIFTMDEVNETQSVESFQFVYGAHIPVAVISVSSDSITFGNVNIDSAKIIPLTIRNIGDMAFTVDSLHFSHPEFSAEFSNAVILNPMDSLTLAIQFLPQDTVHYNSIMNLFTNIVAAPAYEIQLSGKGMSPNGVEDEVILPQEIVLEQNYPNPFNPRTTIHYALPYASFVKLKIYDTYGRELAALVNEQQTAGNYFVEWNAENFPSGIYFYRLQVGSVSLSNKLLFIK
ncbi:MAG: choice-of-anchor B family protein, partial [Bacteroidota bacterium]